MSTRCKLCRRCKSSPHVVSCVIRSAKCLYTLCKSSAKYLHLYAVHNQCTLGDLYTKLAVNMQHS